VGSLIRPLQAAGYRGRFAPSPTGLLHLGSLLAAAGSYLQARARNGAWLVRMEDLDATRTVPGAGDGILRTLERLGFEWDGEIVRQSARSETYAAALSDLQQIGAVFPCSCSRRDLPDEGWYPGTCRDGVRDPGRDTAFRFRVPRGEGPDSPASVAFEDLLQGLYVQDVARVVGDFVVRRRDGYHAYQLAVVVDDAAQGITEVVRGYDLLDNTPRQILLQRALSLPQPAYVHLPLLVEADGNKLSKSRRSLPVGDESASLTIHRVLTLLGQTPPPDLAEGTLADTWKWAVAHWRPQVLRGVAQVADPPPAITDPPRATADPPRER